jgi:hypothetical protein
MSDVDNMAFPIQASDLCGSLYPEKGLNKRELFAAMAMQGLLAKSEEMTPSHLAQWAVTNADALLAALKETPSERS